MNQQELWDRKWEKITKYIPHNKFAERSFSFIKDQGFKTLLDIGCGDGKDSLYFAEKFFEVTAIDFSKTAIEHVKVRLKKNGLNNVVPLQMDVTGLHFTKKFDVIYSNSGMHFFDDITIDEIFSALYDLLNPGGFLFIKTKSIDDLDYGKGQQLGHDYFLIKNKMVHFFSEDYMEEKLNKFKIIDIKTTDSMLQRIEEPPVHSHFIEVVATKLTE